jgi:hypothetical protein
MAYQDNNNKNKEKELLLKDFEPQMMGGTIGGLDLIGGGAVKGLFKLGKTFANAAKQYLRGGKAAEKVSNFKPLVTGNKIYDRQSINDAFAKRFGKPQADVTDGWGNTVEGVAKGINVGAKPLTSAQKALVNQKDIIKNSATLGKTNFFK